MLARYARSLSLLRVHAALHPEPASPDSLLVHLVQTFVREVVRKRVGKYMEGSGADHPLRLTAADAQHVYDKAVREVIGKEQQVCLSYLPVTRIFCRTSTAWLPCFMILPGMAQLTVPVQCRVCILPCTCPLGRSNASFT